MFTGQAGGRVTARGDGRAATSTDLPGKGKPQNLDAYFEAPEDMRAGFNC